MIYFATLSVKFKKIAVLSPWDKSVLILKWPKETQYCMDTKVKHFFVILNGISTKKI